MFHSLRKPVDACLDQYRGTVVLLKISGKQLLQERIKQLVLDVKRLTREGIRFIIVFGGGEQIDQRWKQSHSEEKRPKAENGEAITTSEIRDYALDAYREICEKLRTLMPEVLIIDSGSVHSILKKGLQLTGEVQSIDLPDADGIVAVGFIGTVDKATTAEAPEVQRALEDDRRVNVNADGVSRVLALRDDVRLNIKEVIMVTETKGVLDKKGNVVPVLTIDDVNKILAGVHPMIEAKDGMVKKLQECLLIAKKRGKAVMTDAGGIGTEIEQYKGSGTLIFDPVQCSLEPLTEMQEPIFDAVYAEHSGKPNSAFKTRSAEEIAALKRHHLLLDINGSPLGGLSMQRHGEWTELGTFWSEPPGNGLGEIVLMKAIERVRKRGEKIFACALMPNAIRVFRKTGQFHDLGPLSQALVEHADSVPAHLIHYPVKQRDPHLFILENVGDRERQTKLQSKRHE